MVNHSHHRVSGPGTQEAGPAARGVAVTSDVLGPAIMAWWSIRWMAVRLTCSMRC
jgi:hypothetical protein